MQGIDVASVGPILMKKLLNDSDIILVIRDRHHF